MCTCISHVLPNQLPWHDRSKMSVKASSKTMATFEMGSGYHVLYRMCRLLLQTVRIFTLLLPRPPYSSQWYCASRNLSGSWMWELHSRIAIISLEKQVEDGHCRCDKRQTAAQLIVVHMHTGLSTFRYKCTIAWRNIRVTWLSHFSDFRVQWHEPISLVKISYIFTIA